MPLEHNLITDVPGILVGHSVNATICTGVTVIRSTRDLVGAVDVRGGATGTRELGTLSAAGVVDTIHAIVLSGGSAFGLGAASGVQSWLVENGQGFRVGPAKVPIVPQAILFDLLNGGHKAWGRTAPYEAMAYEACINAGEGAFEIGSIGAGYGATTATWRGGLGSASERYGEHFIVGGLAAVNAVGSATVGTSPYFWAHNFEQGKEFGGKGAPPQASGDENVVPKPIKGGRRANNGQIGANTTLAVIATNARLSKAQTHRLAVMAQTGMAKALHPIHTPMDGDIVFAISTGEEHLRDEIIDLTHLGAIASEVLARSIARGVFAAAPVPEFWQGAEAYCSRYPTAA